MMLIPRVPHYPGIVIEFKKLPPQSKLSLEDMAQIALDQIVEKKYAQELRNHGAEKIIAYGISFERKNVYVKSMTIE
jgi:hypothetical protein